MVKFTLKEADENSTIYETGFIISSLKINKAKKTDIKERQNES